MVTYEEEIECPNCGQIHRVNRVSEPSQDLSVARAGVKGVTASVAAPVVANVGLRVVGFGAKGVIKKSIAAGIQSGIGNVAKGSLFARATALGATGGIPIFGAVSLAFGAFTIGYEVWKFVRENRRIEQEAERVRRGICRRCWDRHYAE